MDKRNNHGDGVIQLEGHVFKRVKQGLDEEQVLSFVNELIDQRDKLLQRQAHLSSLIELAERTVAEADNIAQKIKQEAVDKARVDADEILAKASEEAKEMVEQEQVRITAIAVEEAEAIKAKAEEQAASTQAEAETIKTDAQAEAEAIKANAQSEAETIKTDAQSEVETVITSAQAEAEAIKTSAQSEAEAIRTDARAEAETIKTSAQEQAETIHREKIDIVKSEVRDLAQRLYGELLSGIENFKQQVMVTEANFEQTMSQLAESLSEEQVDIPVDTLIDENEDNILPAEDMDSEESPEAIHNISTAIIEKMQTDEQADTSELEKQALTMIESLEASDDNNLVTLEVLPPVDIHRIMGVISQLEDLPEVRTTELIPVMPKPLITVFLKEPLHITEVLRTFPEIQEIEEVFSTEETDTADITAERKQNRIQITFTDDYKGTQKNKKS